MRPMLYVAYYRVSTDRQGRSGLGLDAQAAAVAAYVEGRGELVDTFTEIEGHRTAAADRPELLKALALCRQRRAILIIAKLDRLARDVHFISGLLKSGVEFVAADMPHASKFEIHIRAALAEEERERISIRTKEALASAKRRGIKLGNPRPETTAHTLPAGRATAARNAAAHRAQVQPLITELHGQGLGLSAIARELNRRSIPTARGRQWEAATVKGILKRQA